MHEEARRGGGAEEVLELERGRAGGDERDGDRVLEERVHEHDVFLGARAAGPCVNGRSRRARWRTGALTTQLVLIIATISPS